MPSPRSKSRHLYTPRHDEEEDQDQKPTSFEADVAETIAKKQEEEDREKEKQATKSPDSKKEKELASFNRLIAISNKTVREAYLESTLATFASTEPDQKAKLTKFEQLSNLSKNASYYDFINHLVTNQMAPSYGNSELQDEVESWCMDSLMQLSAKDINFIISGFPSTGKSSTLYSLSTILFRKIQQSASNGTFLFFPMNFQKYTLEFNSITQIYLLQILLMLHVTAIMPLHHLYQFYANGLFPFQHPQLSLHSHNFQSTYMELISRQSNSLTSQFLIFAK
ncbi:hypothetical protein TVAG_074390 [Trichomonas vaginalis G3]|uniref:Uncharacterized protein n=1 Tax=Trichomonas vaginalis (strain ATCC PRA-98 / G3) TaxID=412133 RepID=A2E3V6_TRIV3|nr:hypothetical protein TVAGG3_0146740 [Trichomonas vaginalis G3]EAY12611.1 hypothetical protein TVAG_074390 [Trichomonas vaginalis G3]KAI5546974.1 hypothetical protein TVAGG3_0146740 [Trichomonas vaginalis G3]|eukprot:XP_001324834.1 hypothetical protein [Trichomonas vaginalis G3]